MPGFDSLTQDQLIAHIVERLKRKEPTRQPAFTLLIGSGFSAPLIPTAGQVVASDVAWWLHWRQEAEEGTSFRNRPAEDGAVRVFEQELWRNVHAECGGGFELGKDGLPKRGAENIGLTYRAIMSGRATSGLSDPEWRRRYLRDLCARVGDRVNGAHIYLASILRAQEHWPNSHLKRPFCRTIFTTNFDPLLQRSLQLVSRLYFMSDRPEAFAAPEDDDHEAIHLIYSHGSIHRYLLLNTEQEIESARVKNATPLVPYFQRHGVLVVGYSGWQDATMEALMTCQSFGGNLYWCDVHPSEETEERLSPDTKKLLTSRRGNAFYVPIAGADELMLEFHRALGLGEAPGFIRNPIGQMIDDLLSVEVPEAREPSTEPRLIDSLKDARDRTVARLKAARQAFDDPARLETSSDLITAYREIIESAITAQRLGKALDKGATGDLVEAIRLWTKIIEDEQTSPAAQVRALYNRGVAHGKQGHPDLAITDYSTVLDMPDAPSETRAWALYNRGVTHALQGHSKLAIADYSAVLDMPDAPAEPQAQALVNRGVAHYKQGHPDLAIADYSAVLDIPNAPAEPRAKALGNRGWVRFCNHPHDLTGLLEDSEAALGIVPTNALIRYNLGLALLLSGETERARKEYERAGRDVRELSEVSTSRKVLERELSKGPIPGAEEILTLLRAREAESSRAEELSPSAGHQGS